MEQVESVELIAQPDEKSGLLATVNWLSAAMMLLLCGFMAIHIVLCVQKREWVTIPPQTMTICAFLISVMIGGPSAAKKLLPIPKV